MLKEFVAARKEIKKGPLKRCYCFWGEEDFFKTALLKEIQKIAKSFDISRFSSELRINQIQEVVGEDDFFSRKRLVIISDFDKVDKKDKIIRLLRDGIPDDVVICLLAEKEVKKLDTIENIFVVECKVIKPYDIENIERFISSVVKGTGYAIEQKALKFLISTCGNNLNFVVNELLKVFTTHPKGYEVTINDLREIVYIKPQDNIFQLTDYIAQGNDAKCLSLIDDFEITGQSSVGIVHYLYGNFRTLCIVLDMGKNNFDLKEMSSYLKIPFFVVKNLQRDAKKLGLKRLLSFFKDLCEIDLKQKSSDVDGFTLLRRFVIRACRS